MVISFDLPHVFFPSSSDEENAYALRILLDMLVKLNLAYLQKHPTVGLYDSGVFYRRTKIWDTIPALYRRGFGDCKSLSAALVAQYLAAGISARPVFRFQKRADGGTNYHILVFSALRGFEDPSRILGMGQDENAYFGNR